MPSEPKVTKAQIKRFILDEVRKAAKTQLADSSNRQQPISDQFGVKLRLSVDRFTLGGFLIPDDPKIVAALQKLAKPPKKKKSAAT